MISKVIICFFHILCILAAESSVHGPITPHFEDWLNKNGYEIYNFARHDLHLTGSYGGKLNDEQRIVHTPIIFHHGNSDGALAGPGPFSSGSSAQIEYFLSKGYTSAELYVTTWGNRSVADAAYQAHNCSTITQLRKFMEAVMEYTKSEKIIIFSHSMGVTLARKMIKGGGIPGEDCDIGPYLGDRVELFLGIAGANYGMCSCIYPTFTCNSETGFYPGASCGNGLQCSVTTPPKMCEAANYSQILQDMNHDGLREGKNVVVFWTRADDIISYRDFVWGRPSSRMPTMDREIIFENFTHMQTKELTVALQYELVYNYTQQRSRTQTSSTLTLPFCVLLWILFSCT